ncbi:hypothetical protein COCOBI_12-0110 [Coccomyxa sp. Obi]|nr:hypothetical protein COCOBI_12-0110 [Coccomyxa sp. Obi]
MQVICARFGGTAVPFRSTHRTKSRHALRRRRVSSTLDGDRGFNVGQTVSKLAKGANLKTDARLEDFLGDRTERLKDGNRVTWPSEKVTELWKVFFRSNEGYKDVFGVAWPLSEDAPRPSDEDIQMARAEAAKWLVNIDRPERKRRVIFGSVLLAGVWDVDGTGMQAIEDPDVDLGIRKKVVYGVRAGAVATLLVMVPYIFWPF